MSELLASRVSIWPSYLQVAYNCEKVGMLALRGILSRHKVVDSGLSKKEKRKKRRRKEGGRREGGRDIYASRVPR